MYYKNMVIDIACILFACTAVNHLGLVSAIERVIKHDLPILNCSKCLTWWVTMAYMFLSYDSYYEAGLLAEACAISFLNAYLSFWLELGMGCIDTLYYRAYEKIYGTTDNEAPTVDDKGNTSDGMSEL